MTTLIGAAPASRARSDSRAAEWVALMYHDVRPGADAGGGGPDRFTTTLASFERALDLVASLGYRGCSVTDALRAPGVRRVAITFDDGALGQYEHAAPALLARGMTATFYITTDWVGLPGFMSWAQLRELRAHGMSIQSHSRSHPFLSECNAAALRDELSGSKAALDDALGQDTTEISLPGGDAPTRANRPLLAECGYEVVACSRWGTNAEVRVGSAGWIRRCTVRGNPSTEWLERVIGGDRWLALRRVPRESALGWIRSSLGPTRYADWRRRLLEAVR